MTYSAVMIARTPAGWTGRDVDLAAAADLDDVVDLLREDDDTETALLLLEENDEYVAVVRVDAAQDARAFLSDRRVLTSSDLASRLFDDLAVPVAPPAEDDESSARPIIEPVGDLELLEDLGTSAEELLELCDEEGVLPADVLTAVAERAGALEQLEAVRGG